MANGEWRKKGVSAVGGRPSKPVSTNKKHLTNAEKEQRLKFENALLSGHKITERARVKADKTAHGEFKRVVGLLRAIGKDDGLYSEQMNRYAELFSECEFYKELSAELRAELDDLSELCAEMRTAARRYADEFEDNENIADLLEQLGELIGKRAVILRQLSDADTKIKQKREAMLAIERENCMTVSAALRTIPKDVCKDENDDELLRALRGE